MTHCRQCSAGFDITPRETALRDKLSANFEAGPVPPPTLCPDCRMQRRMVWRNERVLYGRPCDLTGKNILSVYPKGTPFPVYERTAWWGDGWDALDFGRDFDFSQPFFSQFAELVQKVPRPSLNATNVENSDYCNFGFDSRNCYLSHNAYKSESLYYCYWMYQSKDCFDCSFLFECERCYQCTDCNHSYGCQFCTLSHTCTDSYFLYDCRGCANCFGCVGLRNKKYCMFNEELTEEAYKKRLKEFDLQNLRHVQAVQERVKKLRQHHPHLYSIQEKTEDCTGDYIFESKNCHHCFQLYNGRDCMYVQEADVEGTLDGYHPGWGRGLYEVYSAVRQQNTAFVSQCWDGSDNFYCDTCQASSHCFGCVGLRRRQYCILNKQYSKEAYLALLQKIVAHMKETNEWGEFFPVAISPFAYNETTAQQFYPMNQKDALSRGWRWQNDLPFIRGRETISWDQIPERTEVVPETILNEILKCADCSKNYRIIRQELHFYLQMNIALPRLCPECRHDHRLKKRNPYKLYKRPCSRCKKMIQSTYAPARTEAVYCKDCYLKEIY